jgi:predicted nuclease of predicted toxin-antitoxin system
MRFLVDAQLPPALARWLSAQGYIEDHVKDLGLTGATDRTIWARAIADGATIITKDLDFLLLQRQLPGSAIIWITLGNCSRADLLTRMEKSLPELLDALSSGETMIEIR